MNMSMNTNIKHVNQSRSHGNGNNSDAPHLSSDIIHCSDLSINTSTNDNNLNGSTNDPSNNDSDSDSDLPFVNLDAFELLADLSTSNNDSCTNNGNAIIDFNEQEEQEQEHSISNSIENNLILDINPDWSWTEGSTKILIIGQFHNNTNNLNTNYIVHFGQATVPAIYLQYGVLKCYCPPHTPGLVPIHVSSVSSNNIPTKTIIPTNSMVFEYKTNNNTFNLNTILPQPSSEITLKLLLINRIENIIKYYEQQQIGDYKNTPILTTSLNETLTLESSLINILSKLLETNNKRIINIQNTIEIEAGLTLLHLIAGLGYNNLLLKLIEWNRIYSNNNLLNNNNINPLLKDNYGLVPIMWSINQGHLKQAIILAQWCPESILERNFNGENSIEISLNLSFNQLAIQLENILLKNKLLNRLNSNSNTQLNSNINEQYYYSNTTGNLSNNNKGFQELSSNNNNQNNNLDFSLKDCFFGPPATTESEAITIESEASEVTIENTKTNLNLNLPSEEESRRVLTLAEQIIAAMPERIKVESCEDEEEEYDNEETLPLQSDLNESSCSMLSIDTGNEQQQINDLDYSNERMMCYRYNSIYNQISTPCSSPAPSTLSTTTNSCLESPCSSNFNLDSPQPTTTRVVADFTEFLQASNELNFSALTLSDSEQRELYKAAKIIQKAYRSYKDRRLQIINNRQHQYYNENEKINAALVIQNYYRRYKEYAYLRQVTPATATVASTSASALLLVQNQYTSRNYIQNKKPLQQPTTCSLSIINPYQQQQQRSNNQQQQRRQHLAAKKIQQFMKNTKINWDTIQTTTTTGTTGLLSTSNSTHHRNLATTSTATTSTTSIAAMQQQPIYSTRKREASLLLSTDSDSNSNSNDSKTIDNLPPPQKISSKNYHHNQNLFF